MEKFTLLVRGGMPPQDQMQEYLQKWGGWIQGLATSGKMTEGSPLMQGGKVISGTNATDLGSFSSDTVGSYVVVNAETMDEAVKLAMECPALTVGGTVEVRQVMKMNM